MAEENLEQRYRRLEQQETLRKALGEEREISDDSYAVKLVEKIVFGFAALIGVGVAGAVLSLIIK